jgi:hypothetical protein
MIIIGILGYNGAGKDTIANYLIENYGFFKFSFGSALKDVVSSIYSWPRNALEGDTKESREWREEIDPYWGITPRKALETIGTQVFRGWDKDIWVKCLEKKLKDCPKHSRIVITDCRFENEIALMTKLGGVLIRVERSPRPIWFSFVDDFIKGKCSREEAQLMLSDVHPTLWESYFVLEKPHYIIENKSNLKVLYDKVDEVMSKCLTNLDLN